MFEGISAFKYPKNVMKQGTVITLILEKLNYGVLVYTEDQETPKKEADHSRLVGGRFN